MDEQLQGPAQSKKKRVGSIGNRPTVNNGRLQNNGMGWQRRTHGSSFSTLEVQ